MFTIQIPRPTVNGNQVLKGIEVIDLASGSVVTEEKATLQVENFSLELSGARYDNKLQYRFIFNDKRTLAVYKGSLVPLAPGGLRDALQRLDPSVDGEFDLGIFEGVSPNELAYLCRNILMSFYQKVLLRIDKKMLKIYDNFIQSFSPQLVASSPEINYVHQIMWIMLAYVNRSESRSESVAVLDEVTVDRILVNYCRANTLSSDQIQFQPGLLVAKGHIMGLSDRELASKCYARALSIGSSFIQTFLRVDALTTYFGDVPSGYSPEIVAWEQYNSANDNRTNICFSVDAKYFKMYGPLWAATSALYKDYVFNYLIVTETREEFEVLAQNYNDLVLGSDRFIHGQNKSNVRLFWLKNSNSYGRTLYACARFYLASKVLHDTTGDVFVSDIDQILVGDLAKFLSERRKTGADVQLALVENYYANLPGRSHLAGYIYMRNSDLSRGFADDVTDYIAVGLGVDFSWMLDQNAVRYGAERTEVSHLDMRSVRIFGHYGAHKDALRLRLARVLPSSS